mmetsp:Transcript_32924/g.54353  ORF Transcript_32924/g.54353 Transcript_32924/m.54353 type:complete len:747 (+) Transcript_32924:27-2267(+)
MPIQQDPSPHRQQCLLVCLLLAVSVCSFSSPPIHSRRIKTSEHVRLHQSAASPADGADDSDDDWLNSGSSSSIDDETSFASRSQMPQFIDDFLEKERDKRGEVRPQIFTHMIGVPMTDCHQLQIELESVQRAILYHCPPLVHACIVPSMSRMPLLFVDASREPPSRVTMDLQQMVEKVVRKHCFVKEEFDGDEANYAGVNTDGYKPLTMTFHKLQIDGEDNEVLHTVADNDSAGGLSKMQAMVAELEQEIHARGWKATWPPSDIQGMQEDVTEGFAPRIPLMRLPPNFENVLRPLEDEDDRWLSEDGGNGISPMFWIKWENDVMGRNVRLREIGIYPRRPGMSDLTEQTFYLPHEIVELPGGNEALAKQEKSHQNYNEKRMKESERRLTTEDEDFEPSPDGDFMDPSLSDNRKILESIYGKDSEIFDEGLMDGEVDLESQDSGGASAPLDNWMQERINNINGVTEDDAVESPTTSNDVDSVYDVPAPAIDDTAQSETPPMEDWMQDRIRDIVEKRPSYKQRTIQNQKKENVPNLDDNPIFQAYRDGTLVGKINPKPTTGDSQLDTTPFPSEEQLRGFWKVVRSPITSAMDVKAESRSDNFALRVDGTVSGGPMLDQETQQKAGGGTWRMLGASDETTLRIRLVIPPKRERIMVWEGEIYKELEARPASNSASVLDATSFGKVTSGESDELEIEEEVIKCSGTVWIEDAVTKRNREELGSFVLTKVNTSTDPRDFTITIPKAVRTQD